MTITHIVLVRPKASLPASEVQEVYTRMLALGTKCLHPQTKEPYILRASGGRDCSEEGLQGGFTHGFVMEFASKEDRDYYVEEDPAHKEFVGWAVGGGRLEEVRVVDFEGGVF